MNASSEHQRYGQSMKYFAALFLCLAMIGCAKSEAPPSGPPSADSADEACGIERWDVKNLLDKDVANVNFTSKASSISEIQALQQISVPDSAARMSFERQT